mmetsp:Transcript_1541/g.4183  ORF Transcript_1541/g.4183 Transcript_1541/m.4183 type:complete len:318 (-) Transcript_1541:670-1623(-)
MASFSFARSWSSFSLHLATKAVSLASFCSISRALVSAASTRLVAVKKSARTNSISPISSSTCACCWARAVCSSSWSMAIRTSCSRATLCSSAHCSTSSRAPSPAGVFGDGAVCVRPNSSSSCSALVARSTAVATSARNDVIVPSCAATRARNSVTCSCKAFAKAAAPLGSVPFPPLSAVWLFSRSAARSSAREACSFLLSARSASSFTTSASLFSSEVDSVMISSSSSSSMLSFTPPCPFSMACFTVASSARRDSFTAAWATRSWLSASTRSIASLSISPLSLERSGADPAAWLSSTSICFRRASASASSCARCSAL